MKQHFHTIIKPQRNGSYVGWVEEVPGTITAGRSLDECQANLRDALRLMLESNRDEARLALDPSCITGSIEIDLIDDAPTEPAAATDRDAPRRRRTLAPLPNPHEPLPSATLA